jgi:hypothetical protein
MHETLSKRSTRWQRQAKSTRIIAGVKLGIEMRHIASYLDNHDQLLLTWLVIKV